MDKEYQRAVDQVKMELMSDLMVVTNLGFEEPVWSDIEPIDGKSKKAGISKALGVYRIIYKPSGLTMYIGKGNIGARRYRHKNVFLNDGTPVTNPGGSVDNSPAAQKMYKHDTDINNWLFSWCDIGNDALSKSYEMVLQEIEKPPFSESYMAGK